MVISSTLLTDCKKAHDCYYISGDIATNNLAILAVFHLHNQKIINNDSFNSYCRQYKEDTLIRRVNTYHSKITDKWYSDVSSFTVLMDTYDIKCRKEDFSLEQMLYYLNRLTNRNKNYCIDQLYFQYVEPVLNRWSYDDFRQLSSFEFNLELDSYDKLDASGRLSDGYCCSDCDGCLGEYKRSKYRTLGGSEESHSKEIKAYLNNKKTASALRNPNNRLLT